MNPAYSVILFTTASGAGYGLLALTAFAAVSHGPASSRAFAFTSLGLALALITLGLLSSTAHLGRPERAWRAFSQWRSSWLSREGVASVLTYPVALAFGAAWSGLVEAPSLIAPFGILTVVMCGLTVYCTAKIYASLKTIPAWNNRFTVPVYFALSLATGAGLLSATTVFFGQFQAGAGNFTAFLTLILIFTVITLKMFYWRKLRRNTPSFTMAAATGLGEGVRQWDVPHTAQNFIMKEMGFQIGRKHGRRLQQFAILLLDIAFMFTFFSPKWPWLAYGAVPILLLAAWTERWLFFAQAEHVAALYYGKERV